MLGIVTGYRVDNQKVTRLPSLQAVDDLQRAPTPEKDRFMPHILFYTRVADKDQLANRLSTKRNVTRSALDPISASSSKRLKRSPSPVGSAVEYEESGRSHPRHGKRLRQLKNGLGQMRRKCAKSSHINCIVHHSAQTKSANIELRLHICRNNQPRRKSYLHTRKLYFESLPIAFSRGRNQKN